MRNADVDQGFSPDGLTEDLIDALLAQMADELAELPPATSALLDGTARKRRDRRAVDRQLGGTVRVLRVHGSVPDTAGTEAA